VANPAADRSTRYAYDAAGCLAQSTDGEGNTEQYAHDAWANTLAATTSRGFSTHYRYNALNQVIEEQYDALGHLTRTVAYSSAAALQDLPLIPTARQPAARLAPVANPAAGCVTRYAYDA